MERTATTEASARSAVVGCIYSEAAMELFDTFKYYIL